MRTDNFKFDFFRELPPEIAGKILTEYTTGKDLSTLLLAVCASIQDHYQRLSSQVVRIGNDRIGSLADYIESKTAEASKDGEVDGMSEKPWHGYGPSKYSGQPQKKQHPYVA